MIALCIATILAVVAFPVYQDYVAKTQINSIYSEINAARSNIERCVQEGRLKLGQGKTECAPGFTGSSFLETNIPQDGSGIPPGTGVPVIGKLKANGEMDINNLEIMAVFGNEASGKLKSASKGYTMRLTRYALTGIWKCTVPKLDPKYRPAACSAT